VSDLRLGVFHVDDGVFGWIYTPFGDPLTAVGMHRTRTIGSV
jgi:hypothetical protein